MEEREDFFEVVKKIVRDERSISPNNLRRKLGFKEKTATLLCQITSSCPEIYETDGGMLIFDDGTDYLFSPAS